MKRSVVTAVLAASVLLVAGCSSNDSGTASTTTAAATSTAASSSAESAESSGGVVAAELDAQTVAWFEALCDGAAPIAELASTADTTGLTDAEAQLEGVELLNGISAAFADTGAALAGTPPPTFDGGEEFASTMASGLTESGTKVADLAASLGAIDPTDSAALEQAVTELPDELTTALSPLAALGDLDPAISAAAQEIPACAALG
jgi:hypothetical protein